MQKIASILLVLMLLSACSLIRKGGRTNIESDKDLVAGELMFTAQNQNITKNSFIILKADIELISQSETDKMIATVKYSSNREFLISIRGKTGIEAARIFISKDTILVNDRINRQQLCASPGYLNTKYGFSQALLPMIFGDFIGRTIEEKNMAECKEGMLSVDCATEGIKIRYILDCKMGKPLSALVENSFNSGGIEFQYKEFFKYENRWIPGEIEVRNLMKETTIKIILDKMSIPWEGDIEFIPGRRYEIIDLL